MTDSPEPREPKTPPLDAATLGAFVARVRTARGLTQRQLAERLYVSDKTVSKWERGLSLPSVPLLVPLAGALGLSISELMACEEAPHEERLGRAEADRLIAASLDLSGATPTGRQRALRCAVFAATVAVWGVLTVAAAHLRNLDTLLSGFSDPAVSGGLLMLVALAWFSFFCHETLPGYYDENRISFVTQGPFRMNLGCLMRVHNGNWPAICRAARWSAAAAAVLLPTLELAPGDVLPNTTVGLLGCAVFFVPILVAGKLNE
uniref:helix-turn-helix domain-containing protein n=1 Tax=Olsenella timonensis TaxID=1805478 RepID=UPI00094E26A8|nr:helix-turn-helix domain-containing protein [Olsenella timonensis]